MTSSTGFLSLDGNSLAYVATHNMVTGIDILNVLDGTIQTLTSSVEPRSDPFWSPEGARLVFQANANGNMEIYVVTIATGEFIPLAPFGGFDGFPIWVR